MDEPVPIEGIIEGEPESLAAVCAAGGSAILAYCSAVGARAHVAETVVTALATFRRGVVENADQDPAQLERLLLTCTTDAARRVAGVDPLPVQQAAGEMALETAVTAPLHPALAPRIIRALVEAAPVTALGGDVAAVRRATEEHYRRVFDGPEAAGFAPEPDPDRAPAPATPAGAATATAAAAAAAAAAANPKAQAEADEGAWVPLEVAEVDVEAMNARAVFPRARPDVAAQEPPAAAPERFEPAPAAPEPPPPAPEPPPPTPEPPPAAPEPAASEPEDVHAPLVPPPPNAPLAPPEPGAFVIKRGGHWPVKRPGGKPSRGGGGGGGRGRGGGGGWSPNATRNAVLAGVAGLALGGAIAYLALPEKEVQRDAVLVRTLDTPFTVDGAVFNIARTNRADWALAIRRRPLRPGRTWLTIAAQTRNIDRPNFTPRSLGYRVRTATGIVIGPDTAQVPTRVTAARGRQAIGERGSVHLGFQIPSGQRGLTFEFDPVPRSGPRVRVPLS